MISWCKKIQDALSNDSRWKASIHCSSSLASQINSIIYNDYKINTVDYTDNNSATNMELNESLLSTINHDNLSTTNTKTHDKNHFVDIIDLLGDISPQLSVFLMGIHSINKYPTNAIFKFENYVKLTDQNKLIADISTSAFNNGTVLSIQKTNDVKLPRNPYYSVVLACVHFGNPRSTKFSSKKKFAFNKTQANNTIKQVAHSATSIKNKSRNSHYERVHFDSTDDEYNVDKNNLSLSKTNRTSSKKCNCTFCFTIFFDPESSSWYLKKKLSSSDDHIFHSNHIWINPLHLTMPKKTMSPSVMKSIECLISSGHEIPSIQLYVKDRYKENIDYQTIYNLRMNSIASLLKACNEKPYGTSVDKLISIFKHTKSVSFVYILHRANSGFVTFRKSRNESLSEYVTNFNHDATNQLSRNTISNWRGALSLSDSNNVLVAFAWAHDEELKAAQKHPQFLACDVTFGVNRERRELFLVAGSDGRNRTFTAFRCFIPSKQEQAYSWILNEALTHILTSETLKFNQCISCDQELALNIGIKNAINSNKQSLQNSQMRLDCFHFFIKVWTEKVILKSRDSDDSKSALVLMKSWISSWFNYIESEEEFNISLTRFNSFLESKQNIIGDVASDECTKLVSNIKSKKEYLLHYFFIDVATFDFVGDSIVEGANFPIKHGPLKVSSKMDISNSGYTQLKSTEAKYLKEYVSSAKTINSMKTWTQSPTAKYLTSYAEGIACSNFDRSAEYMKKRVGDRMWYVVHNKYLTPSNNGKENYTNKQTRFTRIRIVHLTSTNHLTCDCGYPKRMLMPCVHICCIIGDMKYYTIELFNLKWWKHFNYLYKLDSSNYVKETTVSLEEALKETRINDFDNHTGKYHGVPLNGTTLLDKLINDYVIDNIDEDTDLRLMQSIVNMKNLKQPLEKGSDKYFGLIKIMTGEKATSTATSTNILSTNDDVGYASDTPATMGAGSQVESHLSEFREENSSQLKRKEVVSDNFFNEIVPYFKELVKSITNKDQLMRSIDMIEKVTFQNIADNVKKSEIGESDTTFLGEYNGPKRKETRHKFLYERFK